MPFSTQFVRFNDYCYPTMFRLPPAREQPGVRARRIFVIKQSIRPVDSRTGQALPATNAAGEALQRIVIFDDHPDSLRLLFGRSVRAKGNRPPPPSARWWEPILGWMLIAAAFILICLPLFLKLPS